MSIRHAITHFAAKHRLKEVGMMACFALVGLLFTTPAVNPSTAAHALQMMVGMFGLYAAIWDINSWLGHAFDSANDRLEIYDTSDRHLYLFTALAWLTIGLSLLASIQGWMFWAGLTSFGLWILYSHPTHGLKTIPVAGTAVHFVTEIIHFHLAYTLFAAPSANSVMLSGFFALLFAAGHLYHEAMDYEADTNAGLTTGATVWGRRTGFLLSACVLTLASFMGAAIALWQTQAATLWPFVVASSVHAGLLYRHLEHMGQAATILRVQRRYRAIYLVAGGVSAIMWLWKIC